MAGRVRRSRQSRSARARRFRSALCALITGRDRAPDRVLDSSEALQKGTDFRRRLVPCHAGREVVVASKTVFFDVGWLLIVSIRSLPARIDSPCSSCPARETGRRFRTCLGRGGSACAAISEPGSGSCASST
jgi:hypothetical protein